MNDNDAGGMLCKVTILEIDGLEIICGSGSVCWCHTIIHRNVD